ncbi:hypothetical protein OHA25_13815 [Nonomuraea sp. NBC_00507]
MSTHHPIPATSASSPKELLDVSLGYLAFTSMVYLAGFGLVTLGQ